jgi:hypothetical protein
MNYYRTSREESEKASSLPTSTAQLKAASEKDSVRRAEDCDYVSNAKPF